MGGSSSGTTVAPSPESSLEGLAVGPSGLMKAASSSSTAAASTERRVVMGAARGGGMVRSPPPPSSQRKSVVPAEKRPPHPPRVEGHRPQHSSSSASSPLAGLPSGTPTHSASGADDSKDTGDSLHRTPTAPAERGAAGLGLIQGLPPPSSSDPSPPLPPSASPSSVAQAPQRRTSSSQPTAMAPPGVPLRLTKRSLEAHKKRQASLSGGEEVVQRSAPPPASQQPKKLTCGGDGKEGGNSGAGSPSGDTRKPSRLPAPAGEADARRGKQTATDRASEFTVTSTKRATGAASPRLETTSFLDSAPVEMCLEYLTRPHTSWDSAVRTMERQRERIQTHQNSIYARSVASSRCASFASTASTAASVLESTMGSVASAPAGFPRSSSNGSKTCVGTLRRGRLQDARPHLQPANATPFASAFSSTNSALAGARRGRAASSTRQGDSTAPGPLDGFVIGGRSVSPGPGAAGRGEMRRKTPPPPGGTSGTAAGPAAAAGGGGGGGKRASSSSPTSTLHAADGAGVPRRTYQFSLQA